MRNEVECIPGVRSLTRRAPGWLRCALLRDEAGVPMPKFSFQLDVRDPPATVMAKMLDFSERRPEIWAV